MFVVQIWQFIFFFFFFKQKTAYEMQRGLVGSEMCIRDRYQRRVHGVSKKSPKKSPEPEASTPGLGALPSLLPALKPGRIKTSEFHVEELEKQLHDLPQKAQQESGEADKIMPGFITKEMLRDKKRQIVKAEKEALLKDMKEEVKPEVKIVAPPLGNLEQKKKIAEAVKAVIKSTREDQERLESMKHSSDESKLKKKTK
eukprot:TRINITY_DN2108_c0_g1_i4.p1 TRINITY_DN2108_c0_g1~~TRINITY_DN2108_c0_g1_i4.p1  ORF type:complete len:221 (+),score=75.97 TRINITY_DN2108_c0_g1_i4:69-665(+)